MAAPIGNQFWRLRSTHGRNKLFATPELMWDAACEYFEWIQKNPLKEEQIVNKAWTEEIEKGLKKDGTPIIIKITHPYSIAELNKMRPFTIQGLCHYLDCNVVYFNQFEYALEEKGENQTDEDKDFSKILTRIRETIYRQKFEGSASGFLNSNIIARDLGLVDKKNVTKNSTGKIVFENVSSKYKPKKDDMK